ncbi:MAG TPA: cupin domain-containing protein [Candidatus Acidoferrum sp.]|nr:cupin domain-containing protein [Candidatus Acidoferrum sp.]
MQRRSFLQAISSIVPAAGLQEILARQVEAQSAVPAPSAAVHVVGAGEDRFGRPHAMAFSPSLLYKVAGSDTNGGLFIIEHTHLQPGGPPLHLHFSQEEWFYVMQGEVAFQVGKQRVSLRSGESVLAPRRIPHTFSSVGAAPAHLLIAFCPAGKMELYFQSVEANPKLNADPEFWRTCEMELLGPSPFWKS